LYRIVFACEASLRSRRYRLPWSFRFVFGVCVFVDIPIANDAEALLQDRVLKPCGVGARHDDVVVVFVAHGVRRYRMVGILEDFLNDVDALFVQKILHGLDVVHIKSSLCGYTDDVQETTLLCLHLVFGRLRCCYMLLLIFGPSCHSFD
jgi:hypothetical protein